MTDNSKGTSFLFYEINYNRKKFYDTDFRNKLECLSLASHSIPVTCFLGKAAAYLSVEHYDDKSICRFSWRI